MICNWCKAPAHDIGPETTGMEAMAGFHVWLYTREGCGHEMSGPPATLCPDFSDCFVDEPILGEVGYIGDIDELREYPCNCDLCRGNYAT